MTSFKKNTIKTAAAVLMLFYGYNLFSQNTQFDLGNVSGNYQTDIQYYFEDSIIGAPEFPQNLGSNSFLNLNYNRGNFRAGMRYEAYFPTLQGFFRETGSGIPYRYIQYSHDRFDITAGTFYEQFGSGMVFRSYEEWGLGYDSSVDGVRAKFEPVKGLYLTGVMGRQRNAFSNKVDNLSEGLIRGFNAEMDLNQIIPGMDSMKTNFRLGGSFVSRYQEDDDPIQIYPENVSAWSYRAAMNRGGFNLSAEYAHKINDPSAVNNLIYKDGYGLLVQSSYSQKGLGITLSAKRIDNMDFRSDRNATFNNLNVNFLPATTRQHTYRLPTLFPYATQTTGEMGLQAEVLYNIPKGSTLGGKYGTTLTFNFSRMHSLFKEDPDDPDDGYASPFLKTGKLNFQDINFEITRKFSPKFKATFQYLLFRYDKFLFKQLTGFNSSTDVLSHVQVLDMSYKLKRKHTLRMELQHAATKQEFGSWAMALLEYSIAPNWFFAVFDEYNYGNAEVDKRLHYYTGQFGYNYKGTRFTLGYGRQRAGVLCVGGVCRIVPASNGFSFSVTGSF